MNAAADTTDTICARATAPGAGGVGIVRVSGPLARAIAEAISGQVPRPRHAHHARFRDADGTVIDDGLLLYFPGPRSYTGEDVVELQGHGGPALMALLQRRCCALGARPARPGEFTERAFLNGKLDLAQAEAVADLVAAGSEAAARAARRSLDGAFSQRVQALQQGLLELRVWIEAAIDFPEEEIDFLSDAGLAARMDAVRDAHAGLMQAAERGRRLRDGLHVVILGPPNAGKSSLLNALAGSERAIVTDIAGTTRDLLRETIRIDGIELTLVDTAGLRADADAVEAEGIRRARAELAAADLVLAVVDGRDVAAGRDAVAPDLPADVPVLWLHNKADLAGSSDGLAADGDRLVVSARTGTGLDALRARLREAAGLEGGDGAFSARERHVQALHDTGAHLDAAALQLVAGAGELAAEELRLAQEALGAITGRMLPDELLGHIFGSFCIGK
ncbi:MAG: tRNA uridine-5-carboxymethylaminomethyl(34) synthesis GTPase MnmE [Lysobacteraceae bacterium]